MKVAEKREEKAVIEVCPLCGSKMEKGFIGSGAAPIYWNKSPFASHLWYLLSGRPKEWETIFPTKFRGVQNIEAYRCRKCKLIVFKYGETGNSAES